MNTLPNPFSIKIMPHSTSKPASIYAIITFVITLVFSFILPRYPIILTGFIFVIFLSFFVKDRRSTLIAASVCIITIGLVYWHTEINLTQYLFIIFVELMSAIIVLFIKRINTRLNFEKSHMTALFENTTEGIIVTDQVGKIILANSAAEKMFGYEESEMINKPMEVLLPKDTRDEHVALRHTFYKSPQHRSMGSGRDLYAQMKSGDNFPVEVSLSYYYEANHRYVIAFIVNITLRKQIEESMHMQQQQLEQVSNEIRDLNAELERKVEERTLILKEALQKLEQSQKELSEALNKERELNEIKSRFVSMASHEFRTPLSTILSSASLLTKYIKEDEQDKRAKHIERIKGTVKNLNEILEDFLSLGKLDEGKVITVNTPFELMSFIEETTEDIKGLLKSGQRIIFNYREDYIIHSDKKLLKNVLLNLISNAIKFSEPETSIIIESSVTGGFASIKITDQGLGISKEDQEHLFSSFFRGANVVNIQGSGLGLHIVKRYLELMVGTIELTSTLNEGTTFGITIPINLKKHEQDHIGN